MIANDSHKPLLSLLVPTWNRQPQLQSLLEVLLPVVQACPELDLTISDNASTDNTAAYLETLPAHPRVRRVRQAVNYGSFLHLAWLYGLARGKYLWLIGDDDMVAPDLPQQVLNLLQADPELGLLHLPHRAFPPNAPAFQSECPARLLRVSRARELFGRYIVWMTFITSNVLRSEFIHRALPGTKFTTAYWPTDLLIRAVSDFPAAVFNECKITAGTDITWADEEFAINTFDYPLTILQSPVLTRREKSACLHNRYDLAPEFFDRLILHHPGLMLRILCVAPDLCSPAFFLRLVRKALRRLSGSPPPKPTASPQK